MKQELSTKREKSEDSEYVLRLFITGVTPNSVRAVNNIREICEEHLQGRYSLQIIDVFQEPELAQAQQLIALPLLVKKLPLPERKLIGDLSQTAKVLTALGLT
jgi:circadian clock protein KaiB